MERTEEKSSEHVLFSCHLPDKDCKVLLGGAAMSYAAGLVKLLFSCLQLGKMKLGGVPRYCGIIVQESRSVVVF